jgi:hypothetical protein
VEEMGPHGQYQLWCGGAGCDRRVACPEPELEEVSIHDGGGGNRELRCSSPS